MEAVQLQEVLERITRRLDKLETAAFDRHGPRLEVLERALKRIGHQSSKWEKASDVVLDGGPESLVQTAASNRLAIKQLTHDVTRLLTALESEKSRVDTRATLLGLVLALVVFDTLAIILLIISHILIYGGG